MPKVQMWQPYGWESSGPILVRLGTNCGGYLPAWLEADILKYVQHITMCGRRPLGYCNAFHPPPLYLQDKVQGATNKRFKGNACMCDMCMHVLLKNQASPRCMFAPVRRSQAQDTTWWSNMLRPDCAGETASLVAE